jgi:hypothetical protein
MLLNRTIAVFALLVCLAACQSPGTPTMGDAGTETTDNGSQDGGQIDPPHDAGVGDAGEASDAGEVTDAGTADGGTPTPHTVKEWMAQYVHALCAPMTRCPNISGDPYLCEVIGCNKNPHQLPFGPQAALNAFERGEVAVDPAKLSACLAAYENRPCEWFNIDSFEAYPECEGALTPRVSAGGACAANESCEAGTDCTSGTCQAFAAGRCNRTIDCPQGQSCTESGSCIATTAPGVEGEHCSVTGSCASGFTCVRPLNRPANEGYCRQMVGAGETCSAMTPCEPDYVCLGTCQPPLKEGDACSDMCGWDLSDLVCGKTTKQCLYLPKSGPCLDGTHCNDFYAYCDKTQATPTCMPLKKEGDECLTTTECTGLSVPSPITCAADAQGVNRCLRTGTSRCE